jgi:hypothetical protein
MIAIRGHFERIMRQPLVGPMLAHPVLHRAMLLGCFANLMLCWKGWGGVQCPVPALLDVPCPGCGLMRGVMALLHGDVALSIHYHLFAPAALFTGILFVIAVLLPKTARLQFAAAVASVESHYCVPAMMIFGIYTYWVARLALGLHF